MITVEGKWYKVIENLRYQFGYQAKVVETKDGDRVAVKDGVMWRWYEAPVVLARYPIMGQGSGGGRE